MKIKELFEAITPVDPSGNIGAQELYEELEAMLEDAELGLQKREAEDTTHSLGGSFRAAVSGKTRLVKGYTDHGYANSTTDWDLCLQIGNGIQGGTTALEEVRDLFKEAKAEAKEMDPNKLETFDSIFHAYFDDGSVSCKYEYARNYCWIAIRKNKKSAK